MFGLGYDHCPLSLISEVWSIDDFSTLTMLPTFFILSVLFLPGFRALRMDFSEMPMYFAASLTESH